MRESSPAACWESEVMSLTTWPISWLVVSRCLTCSLVALARPTARAATPVAWLETSSTVLASVSLEAESCSEELARVAALLLIRPIASRIRSVILLDDCSRSPNEPLYSPVTAAIGENEILDEHARPALLTVRAGAAEIRGIGLEEQTQPIGDSTARDNPEVAGLEAPYRVFGGCRVTGFRQELGADADPQFGLAFDGGGDVPLGIRGEGSGQQERRALAPSG